jgi:transcriptional regulator with XRE-family HTH domain
MQIRLIGNEMLNSGGKMLNNMTPDNIFSHYPSGRHLDVGGRIKFARDAVGISQQHLAKLLGYSRSNIAQWETNHGRPPLEVLQVMASKLDTTAEWLAFEKLAPSAVMEVDFVKVPEKHVSETKALVPTKVWGIPHETLKTEYQVANIKTVFVYRMTAIVGKYREGDRLLINQARTLPTPAGAFLIWDGFAETIAHLSARMSSATTRDPQASVKIKVRTSGGEYETTADDIQNYGRVIAHWSKE